MMCFEDEIIAYWNNRAAAFSQHTERRLGYPCSQHWQKLILDHLPNQSKLDIIDMGCGAGFFSLLMAKAGHRVTGLDLSPEMLKKAQLLAEQNGISMTWKQAPADRTPFPDDYFDVVLSRNLSWTVPRLDQLYLEWHRLLKPGGFLLNFDADYGKVLFASPSKDPKDHDELDRSTLKWCDALKDKCQSNHLDRPLADLRFLKNMGFNTRCLPDISPFIPYDDQYTSHGLKMFLIIAQKAD